MGMPSKAAVLARVQENASYVEAFKSFFGDTIFDNDDTAYSSLAESIAQFERTATFAPFDSKFDRSVNGTYAMTIPERRGRMLFFSPMTNCSNCHVTAGVGANSSSQMFTDYTYFNIGTPSNSLLNATLTSLGQHVALTTAGDQGLLGNAAIGGAATQGLFKTPTLRNVAVTAPYMHNGAFSSLKTVLDFYDHQGGNPLRATNPDTGAAWATPETAATVSSGRLGMRDLSDQSINDLECFLRILTDQKFEAALPALRAGLSCS
jgi:cytochrome c peroxidase